MAEIILCQRAGRIQCLLQKSRVNGLLQRCLLYTSAGRYRTSSLFMKSCTTLYLEKGAVLLGDNDRTHYPILPGVLPSAVSYTHLRLPGKYAGARIQKTL